MWNKAKLISVEITEPTKKAKFKVCIITLFAPVQTILCESKDNFKVHFCE